MIWMIDGASGDQYRTAMGYPRLQNAADNDEWEIERNLGRKPHEPSRYFAAFRNPLAAVLLKWSTALHTEPARQEKLS